MSLIDSEITSLQLRLASLEEKKRFELENSLEEKSFPLKKLEEIISNKKKQIERNNYAKSIPVARFYDQEKVDFLEPIFNMLKDIQKRLEILENKG